MVPDWLPLHRLAVVLAFALASGAVYAVDRSAGTWGRRRRSRLLLGVPWGTLVAVAVVVAVYLLVQSGMDDLRRPVVIPFRAWSYFYPAGMLLAGLSHASLGHVTGNLLGTLVAGTLAEWAYGHFPRERGRSSFGSLRTNPFARAFLFVPAAIVVCAVLTGLFALGPVIGFSGVVFALWGFALVHYPLGTIVALVAVRFVRTAYDALRYPVVEASASPSYGTPWWAGIAVQGHALGLFLGVLAGLSLLRGREDRPTALRLFAGTLFFSAAQGLWAVYWYRGTETFVLYRAVGLSLALALSVLIAAAVAGRTRPFAAAYAVDTVETFRDAVRSASPRSAALVALVLGAALVAGPAVPVNLTTTTDEPLPGETVTVEGYEVTYVEDVPNGMVGVIEVDAFGETTAVNTSGVVVRNPDRHLWTTAVSEGRLAFQGDARVELGGPGWRETVRVSRTGWRAVGGNATYRIALEHDGERMPVFLADPAHAEATVDGRNVTVAAVSDGFEVRVHRGNETASATLPAENGSVELLGLRLVHEADALYAERDGTRVRVAEPETYRGRE